MLDHLLEPDILNKEELWLEQKVEDRLSEEFAQRWEEDKAEAEIATWENRQHETLNVMVGKF